MHCPSCNFFFFLVSAPEWRAKFVKMFSLLVISIKSRSYFGKEADVHVILCFPVVSSNPDNILSKVDLPAPFFPLFNLTTLHLKINACKAQ
jgi:hypothetical protein